MDLQFHYEYITNISYDALVDILKSNFKTIHILGVDTADQKVNIKVRLQRCMCYRNVYIVYRICDGNAFIINISPSVFCL
jgi:hypothetical protein